MNALCWTRMFSTSKKMMLLRIDPHLHEVAKRNLLFFRFCTSQALRKQNNHKTNFFLRQTGWISKIFIDMFMKFVRGYEAVLEKRFPRTFQVYRIFTIGTKQFYSDAVAYTKLAKDVRMGDRKMKDLTRKELELYYEMPKEMLKVAPILIISAFPFTNYFVFPLAYWFPRYLLSKHFWSIQQELEYALIYHKKKLYGYRPVFRHLQRRVVSVEDKVLRDACMHLWHKIGSGLHPEVSEILAVRQLFKGKPYNLSSLSSRHLSGLCMMHGLSTWGFQRRRLLIHAGFLHQLDIATKKENPAQLNADEMRKACFVRGLNPVGMNKDVMLTYLDQWITISEQLKREESSLLLHCPIFLAYNHPTNWSIIH